MFEDVARVPPRHRRGDRRRRQGDVRVRRPRRPTAGAASRGHGLGRARRSSSTARRLPWKAWYVTPAFRYERPQAGRYRQHHQLGVEVLGTEDPTLDVEVIALADRLLRGCSACADYALLGQLHRRRASAARATVAALERVPRRPRGRAVRRAPRALRRQPAAGPRLQAPGVPRRSPGAPRSWSTACASDCTAHFAAGAERPARARRRYEHRPSPRPRPRLLHADHLY